MANYSTIHVYTDGDVWVVKKATASKASAIRNTKKEALEVARDIALNQGLSITIHGKGNRIERVVNPQDRSSSSSKNDDCFITTACVKYYGLEDNCYQLKTLRGFRDNYLVKSNQGKTLVKQYYLIAPKMVWHLENDGNKELLFKKIFKKINLACKSIEKNDFTTAQNIYTDVVLSLMSYFKFL